MESRLFTIYAYGLTEDVKALERYPTVSNDNIMRQAYRQLSPLEQRNIQSIKDLGELFCNAVDALGADREFALAKIKMQEAVMWCVKGVTG